MTSEDPGQWQRARGALASLGGAAIHRAIRTTIDSSALRAIGREAVLAARAAGRRLVFVGWHGHDFVNVGVYHPLFGFDSRAVIMVPDSFGADVLAHAARGMQVAVVRLVGAPGSTQASRGVAGIIRMVTEGRDALLAVDGPFGPARQVKPGAAFIAQRARAIVVPTVIAAHPALRLAYRWDDHVVPFPGGRITVHFGPLIDTAPADGTAPSIEEIQDRIGTALHDGTRRAEAANSRDPAPEDH